MQNYSIISYQSNFEQKTEKKMLNLIPIPEPYYEPHKNFTARH